ncbi:hypothetical protein RUND412_003791 [Rhizina undulata]
MYCAMAIHNENFEPSSLADLSDTASSEAGGEVYETSTEDDDDLNDIGPQVRGRTSSQSVSAPTAQPTAQGCDRATAGHKGAEVKKEREEEVVTKEEKLVVGTAKREDAAGKTVIMSEDEDKNEDSYLVLKLRSSKEESSTSRKRTVTTDREAGLTKGRKRKKTKNKIIGWAGKRNTGRPTARKRTRLATEQDPDQVDGGSVEASFPEYLRARKAAVEQAKEELETAKKLSPLLKIPPDFDDVYFSDAERIDYLITKPQFKEIEPCAPYADIPLNASLGTIPCSIAQYLRDYQVAGAKFLHRAFVYQEGCILGDDMGLGKTVQVIAFLTAAFGKTGDERDRKRMRKVRTQGNRWYPKVLVVCPGSLISNWQREFDVWGWWVVSVFHGLKEQKEEALDAARAGRLEVMITTYSTYKNHRVEINTIEWDCVIADECHVIKELSSQVTKAMNEVNSLCRIGLTGTAIQNKYEELWTLLNWCLPGAVGTLLQWNKAITRPLKVGQSHDATLRQLGTARKRALQLVNNLLPRLFLRRMKTLIADQLPKKTDKVVFCPMTDLQREAYEAFLESEMVQFIKYSADKCDCGLDKKRGHCCYQVDSEGRKWREFIFPCIIKLQKLSNHLAHWIPANDEPDDARQKKLELLQQCLPDHWERLYRREAFYTYMDPQLCGKWLVLQKLLRFWYQSGDKVLIFSYSIALLQILDKLFHGTEYNVCYFDGSMSLDQRTKVVEEFNSDPTTFVFLISTKAGGVGLNITAANKVVIFDPHWNPSHDLQAQDRAYRIGQTRAVSVFRLISAGSIEEIVYARQIYKQQQANIGYGASTERRYFSGVMGDKENKGEIFGLKNLFSFQENTRLKEIVNKTNVAESKAGVAVVALDDPADDDELDLDLVAEDEDDRDGDAGWSQLATIAQGEGGKKKSRKHNPISAILASAGVSYTHENSEVIGSSKVEAQLSRRAMNDKSSGDAAAFGNDSELMVPGIGAYRFHPPVGVMRRQFRTMAKTFGFEDAQEFALVVEGWSQKQRRDALDKFYKIRRDILRGEGHGEVMNKIERGEKGKAAEEEKRKQATELTVGEEEKSKQKAAELTVGEKKSKQKAEFPIEEGEKNKQATELPVELSERMEVSETEYESSDFEL